MTQPPSILIVDDEPTLLFSLSAFFEDEDFVVYSANSGEEALQLLSENEIDVAIVDMRLSGMDGNEVLQRACKKQMRTRFLIHTGSMEYSLPNSLRLLGFTEDHIVIKPVYDLGILLEKVYQLLGVEN